MEKDEQAMRDREEPKIKKINEKETCRVSDGKSVNEMLAEMRVRTRARQLRRVEVTSEACWTLLSVVRYVMEAVGRLVRHYSVAVRYRMTGRRPPASPSLGSVSV